MLGREGVSHPGRELQPPRPHLHRERRGQGDPQSKEEPANGPQASEGPPHRQASPRGSQPSTGQRRSRDRSVGQWRRTGHLKANPPLGVLAGGVTRGLTAAYGYKYQSPLNQGFAGRRGKHCKGHIFLTFGPSRIRVMANIAISSWK